MMNRLVSICIPTWNGEKYIGETLISLINQDYENIEIIVLDNQSTDKTGEICLKLQSKYKRLKYILDTELSGDPEGHHRVSKFANGEYIIVACDDDIYAKNFVRKLVGNFIEDERINLVYCNLGYIDESGKKFDAKLKKKFLYSEKNSQFRNFIHYMFNRNPIPISFGVMRKKQHEKSLKYFKRIERNQGDHDNLFVLSILSQSKVFSVNNILFWYRIKSRSNQLKSSQENQALNYLRYVIHQFKVSLRIAMIIEESNFGRIQKCFLHLINPFSMLKYIIIDKLVVKLIN